MSSSHRHFSAWLVSLLCLAVLIAISGCNLSGSSEQQESIQTETPATTLLPSRTPASTSGLPATAQFPTLLPTVLFSTAVVILPPTSVPPVVIPSTPLPINIAILSPVPGNIVAGNVQVLGSAVHPQFLQYQLEFGPDPNPGNLWFPASTPVTLPVINGLLGIWNTASVQDARYQLRLRVYLRDGRIEQTVIGNITVQNRVNTPVPSPTPNIPRPIAAFTQDVTTGQTPLTVHFTNQSTGSINTISWNFGDGTTSSEVNPTHIFGNPGLYTVTLNVSGAGGSSNVSRQISVNSPSAPVAGFTFDHAGGIAPLTVQFVDQSTGTISSYLWNFSDGITSADRNPQHVFTTPGTYNVILTVAGPGGSSSVIRQIGVTSPVPPSSTPITPSPTWTWTLTPSPSITPTPTSTDTPYPTGLPSPTPSNTPLPSDTPTNTPTPTDTPIPEPVASFTYAIDPNNPLAVQFADTSTGMLTGYAWDFGDTATSTDQNPYHVYQTAGTYNVALTVTDVNGRSATTSQSLTVTAQLNAQFGASVAPNSPLAIQFIDQTGGGTPPYTYAWDFGDGQSSNEQSPAHVYSQPGSFTVHLIVQDAQGRTDDFAGLIQVVAPTPTETPQPSETPIPEPVASFAYAADPNNPLAVQFTSTSSGQIAGYAWDFGDTTGAADMNPSHAYQAAGTYNVTLTVTDTLGRTASSSQSVLVSAPLNAQFAAAADPGNSQTVQFTDQTSGGTPPYLYTWDFGDGQISNDQNPTHAYGQAGSYNVHLQVLDAQGRADDFTASIEVVAPQPSETPIPEPVASFAYAADPNNPLGIQFTNTSTGQIVGYVWDFGDTTGTADMNPYHGYQAAGTYNVTLAVTDALGRTASTSQSVTASAPLNAQFVAAADPGNPQTIQFMDQTSGGTPPYLYTWDFGDGQISNDQNPVHPYGQAGSYNVRLQVLDAQGRADDFTASIEVVAPQPTETPIPEPVASFTYAADPNNPLGIQFTNISTGQIVGYAWDFGDTSGAGDINPYHVYQGSGTYNVTLTITDTLGRTASTSQSVTLAQTLNAQFVSDTSQNLPLTVQFTDQTSGGTPPYLYLWDFGDGQSGNEQNPVHIYGQPGTYSVRLLVQDSQGRSDDFSLDVDIAGAPATQMPPSSIVDTTPIYPDLSNPNLMGRMNQTYQTGISLGNHASIFTYAGGMPVAQSDLIHPFAPGMPYNLSSHGDLQAIIDWFNQTDLGSGTSFARTSVAAGTNWTAADLLNPVNANGSVCAPSETPLDCELRIAQPVLVFISVGQSDLQQGIDAGSFESYLRQIVDTVNGHGVIPVLLTIPPGSGASPDAESSFNETIIRVADENGAFLLNAARLLNGVANGNSGGFALPVSPSGAGDMDDNTTAAYGANALNYAILRTLSDIRSAIFSGAAP